MYKAIKISVSGWRREIAESKVCPGNPLRESQVDNNDRSISDVKNLINERPTSFSSLVGGWLQNLSLQQTGQWHWSWTSVFLLWRHPFKLRFEIFNQLWHKNTSPLLHLPFTKSQLVPKGPHSLMESWSLIFFHVLHACSCTSSNLSFQCASFL